LGASAQTSITDNARATDPSLFGFAFRNINPADLTITLAKVCEWRPQPYFGLVKQPPVSYPGGNKNSSTLEYLDRNFPGWSTTLLRYAGHAALRVAKMAYTGVGGGRIQHVD